MTHEREHHETQPSRRVPTTHREARDQREAQTEVVSASDVAGGGDAPARGAQSESEPSLAQQLQELHDKLAEKDRLITDLERRERINELLRDAEAIDLEATRLLTEAALSQMDEPDVASAVAELKRRKPVLFRAQPKRTAAMSGRSEPTPSNPAGEAAAEAAATGHRRDLLRYLRLRRRK